MARSAGLNTVLFAALIGAGAYGIWTSSHKNLGQSATAARLSPLYQKPYIVVYGRESCGNCQALRRDLDGRSIPYVWKIIDIEPGRGEVFARMKEAGLDARSFMLPVVDVNAEILVHPASPSVISKYRL